MLLNDAKVKRISDTSKLFQYFFSIKRNFFHFPYKMQKTKRVIATHLVSNHKLMAKTKNLMIM